MLLQALTKRASNSKLNEWPHSEEALESMLLGVNTFTDEISGNLEEALARKNEAGKQYKVLKESQTLSRNQESKRSEMPIDKLLQHTTCHNYSQTWL